MVAPFRSQGVAEEHAYLVEEIIEDVTTDLSRLPGSFVVGRDMLRRDSNSSPRDVARELGVAYVIQGSIRVTQSRIRVNVQLIGTELAAHIWAERFDIDCGCLTEARDEITGRLVRIFYMRLLQDMCPPNEALSEWDWNSSDLVFAWARSGLPSSFPGK